MDWKQIEEVNKLIQTIELKGKEYAEVKERVIAFRRNYPEGQIIPEITFTDNYVVCDCAILNEKGALLAKGHARELANKNFALENAETSAIGRALGFCGYGISTSIASAEEMQNYADSQIFDEPFKKDLVNEFTQLYSNMDQAKIMNGLNVTNAFDMSTEDLKKYINFKKYGKEHNSNK